MRNVSPEFSTRQRSALRRGCVAAALSGALLMCGRPVLAQSAGLLLSEPWTATTDGVATGWTVSDISPGRSVERRRGLNAVAASPLNS